MSELCPARMSKNMLEKMSKDMAANLSEKNARENFRSIQNCFAQPSAAIWVSNIERWKKNGFLAYIPAWLATRCCNLCLEYTSWTKVCLETQSSAPSAQFSLQELCLRITISASVYISEFSAIHISMQVHVSASLHFRVLEKNPVFGFVSQHQRISGSSAKSMCPISASMYISGPTTRQHPYIFLSPDPCVRLLLSIHQYGSSARSTSPIFSRYINQHPFISQALLQDQCLRVRK